MLMRELCFWTRFSLAEILVLTGTAVAGGMAPPTTHFPVNVWLNRSFLLAGSLVRMTAGSGTPRTELLNNAGF